MILTLFLTFAKIGLFTFGGGYAMISIIENICVEQKKWITHDEMMEVTVIAESTPGPIMVNLATYIGSSQAGIPGAIIATFAVVLPAFFIILLLMILLRKMLGNKYVQAVLRGLKPCVAGIIVAMGCYMILKNCIVPLKQQTADLWPVLMTLILALLYFGSRKISKRKMSPILLIVVSAALGVAVYGI
ncbi:MAG: chromate transporter [Lachnospiraceae bacterium]|nr:chromate transporter [Lachnospiraceae bacterium]